MRAVDHFLAEVLQMRLLPPDRVGDGVAEHVEEGGLDEGVELGEGLAALGPQGVRRIQNRRNPLLLGERREGNLERGQLFSSPWNKVVGGLTPVEGVRI